MISSKENNPAPLEAIQTRPGTNPSSEKPHQLSVGASMLLDIVRFSAAIGVVVSHIGEDTFGTGWAHRLFWGDIAVPVFFVLSGFVIRFVARTREGDPREYYIDRASRIYSVAIPGMLATLLCSLLCLLLNRDRFLRDWALTFTHPIVRLASNLFFTSQVWGHNTVPFINSPFWSLGYECPYYVFYGLLFFLRGWKRLLACAAMAALIGPQVLFLFPLWWSGVWMYDAYRFLRIKSVGAVAAIVLTLWLAASILPGMVGINSFPFSIQTIFTYIASSPNPLTSLGIPVHHATMFAYAAGSIGAALLFMALLTIDRVRFPAQDFLQDKVRRIADGTLALYLFHYPLLLLAAYAGLFRYHSNLRNLSVVTALVLLCIASAGPLDALKRQMRRWLRTVIPV